MLVNQALNANVLSINNNVTVTYGNLPITAGTSSVTTPVQRANAANATEGSIGPKNAVYLPLIQNSEVTAQARANFKKAPLKTQSKQLPETFAELLADLFARYGVELTR